MRLSRGVSVPGIQLQALAQVAHALAVLLPQAQQHQVLRVGQAHRRQQRLVELKAMAREAEQRVRQAGGSSRSRRSSAGVGVGMG